MFKKADEAAGMGLLVTALHFIVFLFVGLFLAEPFINGQTQDAVFTYTYLEEGALYKASMNTTVRATETTELTLATDNGPNNVSIRRDDYLGINAYIKVHPQANVNIPLTNQGIIK